MNDKLFQCSCLSQENALFAYKNQNKKLMKRELNFYFNKVNFFVPATLIRKLFSFSLWNAR